jgi:KDO2-lipid IV(A) lauroyltransferase
VSAFLSFFQIVSRRTALRIGGQLGLFFRILSRRRRNLAEENIRRAFPELLRGEVRDLSKKVFRHFGAIGADLLWAANREPSAITGVVDIEGFEHAQAAKAAGHGFFFMTAHLGNWEFGAIATAARGLPVTVITRPLDNPRLEVRFRQFREQTGNRVLSKREAARELLRTLKQNGVIGILPDQHAKPPDAVTVPFFGRRAATITAIVRLAERTGALLVPAAAYRMEDDRYRLVFGAPVSMTGPGTIEEKTARMNQILEALIRRAPEQWMWLHNRWREN